MIRAAKFSNEEIILVRIVSTPHVDWQLANSRETQRVLESRKRFREPGVLDARPPGTKWASVDVRCLAPQDSYLVQNEHFARGDPENEQALTRSQPTHTPHPPDDTRLATHAPALPWLRRTCSGTRR